MVRFLKLCRIFSMRDFRQREQIPSSLGTKTCRFHINELMSLGPEANVYWWHLHLLCGSMGWAMADFTSLSWCLSLTWWVATMQISGQNRSTSPFGGTEPIFCGSTPSFFSFRWFNISTWVHWNLPPREFEWPLIYHDISVYVVYEHGMK